MVLFWVSRSVEDAWGSRRVGIVGSAEGRPVGDEAQGGCRAETPAPVGPVLPCGVAMGRILTLSELRFFVCVPWGSSGARTGLARELIRAGCAAQEVYSRRCSK